MAVVTQPNQGYPQAMTRRMFTVSRRRMAVLLILSVWLIPGAIVAAGAEDDADAVDTVTEEDFDDLLDPFDADGADQPPAAAADPPPYSSSPHATTTYRLGGELSLSVAHNIAHDAPPPGETDWRGLSRLRSRLALEFDADPTDWLQIHASGYGFYDFAYAINGRDDYTDPVLDAYESEVELTETFVLLNPVSSIDFRFGRQIVVWGGSDNIRVTDILNPLDLREPGLTDLEYIRLPVTMSRLDCYLGRWRLSGMAIHEIRFDKNPPFGSDYFPVSTPLPPQQTPSDGGRNTEWAASVSRTFSGWDLAFYAADHFNDQAHLEALSGEGGPAVVRRHAPLTMLGASVNVAVGNWLLKTEAAWQDGFQYFNTGDETFSRFDVLAGVEYAGLNETTIGLEVANRHINGFSDRLRAAPDYEQPDRFQSAIRVVREFMNDTLTCTLLAMVYGPLGEDGAFQRLQVDYDLRDNLEVTGGIVFYQSGDLPAFRNIGDNDRVFAQLAYHF